VQEPERSGGGTVRGAVWVFLSLAGVAAAMTCVFLGMRAVMEIGGACAEGGPFVPVRPCPNGVPILLVGGIWLGMAFAAVYVWQVIQHGVVPNFIALLWPALFLSLGWNFLEYGLNPPFGEGLAWGWLICGVVFFVMGGVPLWAAVKVWVRRGGAPEPPMPARVRDVAVPAGARELADRFRRSDPGVRTAVAADPDVVSKLERLDALHRSGAIDDAEYESAKDQVLGEGG
jgi:Short C-terminal domain